MEIVKIQEFFVAYVPETVLSILTIILILNGKIDFKSKKMYLKLVLSNFIILPFILYFRSNFNSIILISFLSPTVYILTYKSVWKYNWRQSIFGGGISIFLIITLEMLTFPLVTVIINNFENVSLLSNKFILFIPTKLLQIITLVIVSRYSFNLKNNSFITSKWDDISLDKKKTGSALIFTIIIAVIFGVNYSDLYIKTKVHQISSIYSINLQIFFWGCILMIIALLTMLFRTIKYEEYKAILRKTPEEFMSSILQNSSYEELNSYTQIFFSEIQIAKINKIEKHCKNIKKKYKKFEWELDEDIAIAYIDYTDTMDFIERIINALDKDKKVLLSVSKIKNNIVINLNISHLNDLQLKAFKRAYEKLDDHRRDIIISQKANIAFNHYNSLKQAICEIEIIMPIQECFRN